jgi:hypothetical protein
VSEKVIIATKKCGHVEVVSGVDHVSKSDLLDWLERGLTLRCIPVAEFREKHAASMLCDCAGEVAA